MNRDDILKKTKEIINGDREGTYGKPEDSFATIAQFWSTYLDHDISSVDVANMMVLLKVARNSGGVYKDDNWIDICGYAALGGEIQGRYTEENFGQYMNELEEKVNKPIHPPYPFVVSLAYYSDVERVLLKYDELENVITEKKYLSVRDYYKTCGMYKDITAIDAYYGWDHIWVDYDVTKKRYFIAFNEPVEIYKFEEKHYDEGENK